MKNTYSKTYFNLKLQENESQEVRFYLGAIENLFTSFLSAHIRTPAE